MLLLYLIFSHTDIYFQNLFIMAVKNDSHWLWECENHWALASTVMDDITFSPCLMSSICLLGVLLPLSQQPVKFKDLLSPTSHAEEAGGGEYCRKEWRGMKRNVKFFSSFIWTPVKSKLSQIQRVNILQWTTARMFSMTRKSSWKWVIMMWVIS